MYPIDRRKLALHIHSLLNSLRKTAILLQVSHSTISRWLKNQARKKYTKSKKTIYKSDLIIESIRTAIYPFISITKLTLLLQQTSNVLVSKELVRIAISKLGLSKKKARFYGEPNNLKEKTEIFLEQRDKYIKQNRRFLSIDETSFGRNGINTFGYSRIGRPLYIKKKQPRVTTTSSKNAALNILRCADLLNRPLALTRTPNLPRIIDTIGKKITVRCRKVFSGVSLDSGFGSLYTLI